ncbi:RAM signaling pathway protein-domain-containing protein [Lyophyllum atratum]|nr:RAM signaling pathway protein-domain-containing protein [Lyophyllum atratum]
MDAVDHATLLSPHSSKRTSFPSVSLGSVQIAQALQRSSDNGSTLMLSKMNLSNIGGLAAEELATLGRETPEDESLVERIALGNNRLTTLPMEFALLSRLRYLNLKHNSFYVFPDVLTSMPSLDTLDISHNRIKALPSQAGQLIHLRVFCFARNKISRLPSYLSQFHNLEVLQVERNPIEWPPKSVMEKGGNLDTRHAMKEWVRSLQHWLETELSGQTNDDSGYSEQHNLDTYIEESYSSWRFPLRETASVEDFTPHSRSFSMDSSFSTSSVSESVQDVEASTSMKDHNDRPPPLHLGMLGSFSGEISPTHFLESYLPSPADSESFDDSMTVSLNPTEPQHHGRNVSYGGGLHPMIRTSVLGKKSMPDLRTAKLNFFKKIADIPESAPPFVPALQDQSHAVSPALPTIPHRQDSGSSLGSSRAPRPIAREVSHPSPSRAVPSMAFERNSYFQRLSTLPTTTALPKPLMCLIDSARSILFAMCQVYQTLEHYMIHAIDDRISSVLRKVLDPASADMMQLINSLDRFDAMGRKMHPSPAVCRGVVESCRDTVAVFNKAVGVLALQLKVIFAGDDMRYSRWILLELYGATSEVSCAWQAMIPQIETIKPMLRAKTFASQPSLVVDPMGTESPTTSPTASAPMQFETSVSLRPQQGLPGASVTVERVRTARRHAGSFSSKDVEIGKKLPSYDDVPGMLGGIISGVAKYTPTLRAPKRQATIPITTISSPSPTTPMSFAPSSISTITALTNLESSHPAHSRQGSQASLQTSASSSPSVPSKTSFLDLPSNSKSQVDREALQAVQAAVEVAPAVWDMIKELFGDTLDSKPSVRDTIEKARVVTARLSKTLQALHDPEASIDRKDLREDAHMFLKMVVQLSNVIKTYKGLRNVSSSLRTSMVKLTNATEEFVILLHVSSFSPSTPRSYTPVLSVTTGQAGPDELRLGFSLSRSRSAQPSASFKLPTLTREDGPRSALPTQSFKVPGIRPVRSRENLDYRIPRPG